ncbi:hypothetical protein [Azospirillum sp. TSO5]|uniref:hypothetical protein n=1 Tax=Azospirillum sp. TSO5 TaxID=716760 RepID=UPI000D649AF9|nr:hypothetical protein [Azospirillum sp. TSO5]
MRTKTIRTLAAALLAATSLSACATPPAAEHRDTVLQGNLLPPEEEGRAIAKELAIWERVPAVREVVIPSDAMTPRAVSNALPPAVASQRVEFEILPGRTVEDLAFLLDAKGVRVTFDDSDAELRKVKVPFLSHAGTLGELASRLENGADVTIAPAQGGGLILTRGVRWSFRAPIQQKEMMKALSEDIAAIGAKDVLVSPRAGEIIYTASPRVQRDVVGPFLERARSNLSAVTLQVALVTVSATAKNDRGIDWGSLSVQATSKGRFDGQSANSGSKPSGSGGTGSAETTDFPGLDGKKLAAGLAGVAMSGAIPVGGAVIGLSGIVKWLDTMGSAKSRQNVELSTLSGVPVSMRDGETVPYIASIGVASIGTTNGSAGSQLLGQTQSAQAESGLKIEFSPRYDDVAGLVTVEVDITAKTIVEMMKLDAGSQVGTMTQPRTQDHELKSTFALQAGEVAVVDGTRIARLTNGAEGPMGGLLLPHETANGQSQSLFVLVRPTIVRFVPENAKGGR